MDNVKQYRDYWLEQLRGELPVLNLPVDNVDPQAAHLTTQTVSININPALIQGFNTVVKTNEHVLFSGLVALISTFLYKYTNQDNILLDHPFFSGTDNNTLVLRHNFTAQYSFNQILEQADQLIATANANRHYPYAKLLGDLGIKNDSDHHFLSEVAVFSQNDYAELLQWNRHKLAFGFSDSIEEPVLSISYQNDKYHPATVERIAAQLLQLMAAVVAAPDKPVLEIDYLSAAEQHQLLSTFNQTATAYPPYQSIVQLFQHQVDHTPDHTAIIFGNTKLTYKQLDEQSNQLAAYLKEQYEIKADELIAIQLERSEWIPLSILGILKSGAAYLPIDPEYPQDRIDYMVADSGCKLIINADTVAGFRAEQDKYSLARIPINAAPQHLVYVIYTSGSTGQPKGCALTNSNLLNYIQWANSYYFNGIVPANFGLFTSLSFDLTVTSIFCPLTQGGSLHIYEQHLELQHIFEHMFSAGSNINSVKITPSHIAMLKQMNIVTSGIRCAIVGGEEISQAHISILKTINPEIRIYNEYGPTEATVGCIVKELQENTKILIGRPIANTDIYILNDNHQLLPVGVFGEIYISGEGLAKGYLNKEELTAEKFISNPFASGSRMYKTGDLGRWMPDGEIEFIGRKDEQVKIRGFRIEPGEIEAILQQHADVDSAVVIARTDASGDKKLLAYIVPVQTGSRNISRIRQHLAAQLPEYMVPSSFIWLDKLPTTTNGKTDKKALPAPDRKRPELSELYKAPKSAEEKQIAAIWASTLDLEQVGVNDNFFELGGNSLLAIRTISAMQSKHQLNLAITKLYQYPTISQIIKYLGAGTVPKNALRKPATSADAAQPIAIIGMAGKFPGASTIEELWEVLREGRETTTFFKKEELDPSISEDIKNDPDYVPARGIIKDAAFFDAAFFGISPKLAELMDPQQRVFLEISRDVLERSGHLPEHYDGTIGVFAGSGSNTYFQNNVLQNPELINNIGAFQVSTVNEKDYISSRTAYQLDLKGPAVSVFSACSTSLLAIAQAVESLRKNQCDVAIAGGSSITSPVNSGHIYQDGAMLSRDGHCRSFDKDATGTVFSDGAGVVLLKTLAQARADGDVIYGLIKGVGVNNDGGGKGSFTAPSTAGQAIAIAMAIGDAAVDPASISYVEAHGTATPLGDPIEIEGLKQAFGEQQEQQYCAIGSIKSNMGHLTSAAGVAGLIKTTLALYHKQIPPSINFDAPNPNIGFEGSPFYVNSRLTAWESATLRRAGVSSFGVGGTNVHVVLEEHDHELPANTDAGRKKQLFSWSARTAESLQGYAEELKKLVQENPDINLADVASTLQQTKTDFNHRAFAVAGTVEELQTALDKPLTPANTFELKKLPGETVFLFPGQGAQYLQMGAALYQHEPVFNAAVDTCAAILSQYLDKDIRTVIYPSQADEIAVADIKNTKYTQPALFVIEYALAQLWISWGISPTVLCGHSIGEYVAAHLAGVFSLEDGLKLIATRGKLVSDLPGGSMLSIRSNVEQIRPILPSALSIAAVNSAKLCVVAGTDEAVNSFQQILDEQQILHKKLLTSHAFHSHMMDPVLAPFAEVVNQIQLSRPQLPIVSTVTGTFLKDSEAMDPGYWTAHLRQTVQFSAALESIFEFDNPVLIECGPGNVCTTLVWQQSKKAALTAVASLDKQEVSGAYDAILNAAGKIWQAGLTPDWALFYKNQQRRKIILPTYAYHRKRCWVTPKTVNTISTAQPTYIHTVTAMRKDTLIEKLKDILENASGIEMEHVTPDLSFVEIGFDSLLLTQVAIILKKEFALPITFRQLNEEYATIDALAQYLDHSLPEDVQPAPVLHSPAFNSNPVNTGFEPNQAYQPQSTAYAVPADSALGLIAQQLQLLSKQVELLTGSPQPVYTPAPVVNNTIARPVAAAAVPSADNLSELSAEEQIEIRKPFGATARIERKASALAPAQQEYLADLIKRYNSKTIKSKNYTEENRGHMADPRVVSGFKPATKEMVYSIVINKSKGSHFWDLDGNDYVDALNGFGSSMLGYQPDVIKAALIDQIEKGYEIGPQHELSGEVCKLICEFTEFDRAALCNTGSEAVLGAMRIARTVTGRSLIVAFTGSYHGIVDEVIVRGTKKLKTFPAAPGIMPEAVENMLILDYGTDESLRIIKERAHELAAVLVEPVQSRRPEFQPVEFLKKVREVTAAAGTALIFDEVISGFRFHPRGTQGLFGIKADLGTYGKVAGGGISVGIIAGTRKFMDALDGGSWQFGDDSIPEIGVTYFAGTFVRHPLTLATTKASLLYMKEQGPQLQIGLTEKTNYLANALNDICIKLNVPLMIVNYGSLWRIKFIEEYLYSELLFTLMRHKNVHILDGFPCFMTTAHSQDDLGKIISAFEESLTELKAAAFVPDYTHELLQESVENEQVDFNTPPLPGAKLGKDKTGNPAWFIQDENNPGKYLQVN